MGTRAATTTSTLMEQHHPSEGSLSFAVGKPQPPSAPTPPPPPSNNNTANAMAVRLGLTGQKRSAQAAAAALRRKQRRAYQKKHRKSQQVSTENAAAKPKNPTQPPRQVSQTSFVSSSSSSSSLDVNNHHNTSTTDNAIRRVPPTMDGLAQVAQAGCRGAWVGIPTECTYEAVTALEWPIMNTNDTNDSNGCSALPPPPSSPRIRRRNQGTLSSSSSSFPNPPLDWTTRMADLDANQQILFVYYTHGYRVHHHHQQQQHPYRNTRSRCAPDATTRLLKHALPSKPYAWRPKKGTAATETTASSSSSQRVPPSPPASPQQQQPSRRPTQLHFFSESRLVLARLATRVWPGPVSIYVRVGMVNDPKEARKNLDVVNRPEPWWTRLLTKYPSDDDDDEDDGTGDRYLCLRSPNHPLAVKALGSMMTSSTTTPSASSSSSSLASMSSIPEEPSRLLVGTPLRRPSNGQACCQANHVTQLPSSSSSSSSSSAGTVLHGEERTETFAVPTCQYGGDPTKLASLWIDSSRRVVTLRQPKNSGSSISLQPAQILAWLQRDGRQRRQSLTPATTTTSSSGGGTLPASPHRVSPTPPSSPPSWEKRITTADANHRNNPPGTPILAETPTRRHSSGSTTSSTTTTTTFPPSPATSPSMPHNNARATKRLLMEAVLRQWKVEEVST